MQFSFSFNIISPLLFFCCCYCCLLLSFSLLLGLLPDFFRLCFCCRFWLLSISCVRTMHNGIEIQSNRLFLLCEHTTKSAASCRVLRFNFIVLYLHTRCAWIIQLGLKTERPAEGKQNKKKHNSAQFTAYTRKLEIITKKIE